MSSARLSLLLLASLIVASPMIAQPVPLQGLDADIRQSMAELQVPGLAIAVVKDDEVVFLKGYGVRELGKDARVDEHTVFSLSSNTKAFTAAAVGLLVDEGKLSWDDPVIQHLPWFRLPDPWVTRVATLRDLLAHRLAGDVGSGIRFLERLTSIEREDVLKRLGDLEPGPGRFRSRYQYCNVCYSLAGEVVGAVSGSSWEDFVRARLMVPLGMSSAVTSAYDLWEAEDVAPCYTCDLPGRTVGFEDARVQNVAMPHISSGFSDDGLHPVPWRSTPAYAPSGSVSASATDLAKWLRLQLGEGVYEGERILSAGVVEEMHTGQVIMPTPWYEDLLGPGFGHFWTYGLGWFVADYQGRRTSCHSGGGVGFSSFIALVPDENLGVAVVMSSSDSVLDAVLVFAVLKAYLGVPKREWKIDRGGLREWRQARERELQAERVQGTTPSLPIDSYVGNYWHPAVGKLTLSEEKGTLVLRFPGDFAGDVEHWHHDVYRMTGRGPEGWQLFMNFVINQAGQVDEFRMRELVFRRLPNESE
jgi:CubicO group peptidase (beta-lactamase class C family)